MLLRSTCELETQLPDGPHFLTGHLHNAAMSFPKTLKVERVDRVRYETRDQVRLDVVAWMEDWYNQGLLHSSINYQTPAGFERGLFAA